MTAVNCESLKNNYSGAMWSSLISKPKCIIASKKINKIKNNTHTEKVVGLRWLSEGLKLHSQNVLVESLKAKRFKYESVQVRRKERDRERLIKSERNQQTVCVCVCL